MIPFLIVVYVGIAWFSMTREASIRPALGFILAPLVPCLIEATLAGQVVVVVFTAPFSYLFALIGVPFYFLYRRLGWLQVWRLAPTAGLLGGMMSFAAGTSHFNFHDGVRGIRNMFVFGGFGVATGLLFWTIAFLQPPFFRRKTANPNPSP